MGKPPIPTSAGGSISSSLQSLISTTRNAVSNQQFPDTGGRSAVPPAHSHPPSRPRPVHTRPPPLRPPPTHQRPLSRGPPPPGMRVPMYRGVPPPGSRVIMHRGPPPPGTVVRVARLRPPPPREPRPSGAPRNINHMIAMATQITGPPIQPRFKPPPPPDDSYF